MKNYKALIVFIVCNVIIVAMWVGLKLFSDRPDPGYGAALLSIPVFIFSAILNIVSLVYLAKFINSLRK